MGCYVSDKKIYKMLCAVHQGHDHRNILAVDLSKEINLKENIHLIIEGTFYDSLVSNDYNLVLDFYLVVIQFDEQPTYNFSYSNCIS